MTMPANTDWLAPACQEKTRADLEWDRLLEALAARAVGPLGASAARHLPFASTRAGVIQSLQEVREARALLDQGEPLPVQGPAPIAAAVERVRAGGVLGSEELRAVARVLADARVLRRFVQARRERIPALAQACATDPRLDALETEIRGSFEPDGSLSDKASPRLRELRMERYAARERLLHKLDEIMRRYESTLQDSYYTEREGRFVLPVRSDSHERFAGIVHGTSSSGQTLFMEPRAIIPLGNRLKMIDADIEREEHAVYARLTSLVGEQVESVAAAEQALAHAELRAACATLAQDLNLSFAQLVDEPCLDLIEARHPLLQLEGVQVVPSDVRLEPRKALIISGPNAGGKSVMLKTLGMAALMLRAGLPLPCRADSRVGVFETVMSDMGDEQSIERNLSTFSAQVRNLTSILDATNSGTLVLLDEIATGTDPREGEALAAAVLDGICARGGAAVCTTHYEGLKALALGDDRFVNASVGFEMASMSPTFKLMMGVPGASSALTIARRFGMPSLIIERAQQYMTTEDRGFEELVRKLNDERRALELARAATETERQEAQRLRRQLESELEAARARERKFVTEETRQLMSAVRRAREELRQAEQRLRSRKLDQAGVREAARTIERVASKVAIGGELEPPPEQPSTFGVSPLTAEELRPGMRVYVPKLRGEAQVVDISGSGVVRIAAGAVKLSVQASELRHPAPQTAAPESRRALKTEQRPLDAAADPEVPIQTSENRCDLRGLRVDDAVAMAEQFLDRLLNQGRRVAFLIHGHGTGALRDALRQEMAKSPYVRRARPGQPGEGGDGVTVVWLR